jgi:hypothetical protein
MNHGAERIDAVQRQRELDAVRFLLAELQRADRFLLAAQASVAGAEEVDAAYTLGLARVLDRIDFAAVRAAIQAAHDEIRAAEYASLFPDLWNRRRLEIAAANVQRLGIAA